MGGFVIDLNATKDISPESLGIITEILRHKSGPGPYLYLLYSEAKKANKIMELGLGSGTSTRAMLAGIRDGGKGHLWNVDWNYEKKRCTWAVQEISRLGLDQYFTLLSLDFEIIADEWFATNQFDLIFIDYDIDEKYDVILKKCDITLQNGGKLLIHNIVAFPQLCGIVEEVLLSTGKYDYIMIQEKYGLAILTKKPLHI